MNMSLVLRLPREIHLCKSSSNAPRLPSFLEMLQNSHVLLTFDKVHNPWHLPRESTSERPKVLPTPQFFALLTSKCASRHNGVHFFDISTSKSALNPSVLYTFDFEMCFAPQRRALFRHLNAQKCVLYILPSKCFSRRNGVQFFISHLPAGSAPAAPAGLLFDPPEPQIGKTQCFATFQPFRAPGSSFFFSSLHWLFPSLLFICPYCRKFDF